MQDPLMPITIYKTQIRTALLKELDQFLNMPVLLLQMVNLVVGKGETDFMRRTLGNEANSFCIDDEVPWCFIVKRKVRSKVFVL